MADTPSSTTTPSVKEEDVTMLEIPEEPFHDPQDAEMNQAAISADNSANSANDNTMDCREELLSGTDILGAGVKALVRAIDDLRALGIETEDLPLPRIVAVGDQSAGKSSLTEGISGIRVPRSGGTCTRCPLQITLTPSNDRSPWMCKVILQKSYDYHPNHPSESAGSKALPFGNWVQRGQPENISFAVVHHKSELEDWIRRAQWAILNPKDNHQKYVVHEVSDTAPPLQVGFSPNIIKLDITEPCCPSLSLIDLPGVINQTEAEDDSWHVGLVKKLVKDYIQNPFSLIMLACSLESDIANSRASRIVTKCNATDRTIGVLTKPDRLARSSGSSSEIDNILSNRSFSVQHGYYITKQPSQAMLDNGITHEEARTTEAAFFATNPWTDEFAAYKSRFGTAQLQADLSEKLCSMIRQCLPDIVLKLQERLEATEAQLQNYPEPPENALRDLWDALSHFDYTAKRHVEVGISSESLLLRNQIKCHAKELVQALDRARPKLRLFTPAEYLKTSVVSLLSDNEEEDVRPPTPSPLPSTKKRKLDASKNMPLRQATPITPQRPVKAMPNSQTSTTRSQAQQAPKSFSLSQIRETLDKLTASDLNETDPRAVDNLRIQCLTSWDQPTMEFLNDVTKLLRETLQIVFHDTCQKWSNTEFFEESVKIVDSFVDALLDEQRHFALRAIRLERNKPMAMNEHDISVKQQEFLDVLNQKRYTKRVNEYLDDIEQSGGKAISAEERVKKQNDPKFRSVIGADPCQQEIEVMSKVFGYYRIAQSRFVDHVVQGVYGEMLERIRTELCQRLRTGLGIESEKADEIASRLLAENREHEIRRIYLKNEVAKIKQAQLRIPKL